MKKARCLLWALASAVLLSIPFLVPGTGPVMLVAFLPLLYLEHRMTLEKRPRFFLYAWLSFSLWNFITTFWVCNATMGGGIFTGFANAFKMALIFQLFHWSKKRLRGVLPYLFLAAMWLAWEKIYFVSPIPWPWLVLGNAFAGSIACVQWYEWTGVLGGSLWVWVFNLGLFGLLTARYGGSWSRFNRKAKLAMLTVLPLLLLVPLAVSLVLWNTTKEEGEELEVLISQPNFDPYEKFEFYTQAEQNAVLSRQIRENLPAVLDSAVAEGARQIAPVLILAPETFTSSLWMNELRENSTVHQFASLLKDYPYATLLMGASSYERIVSKERPSATARPLREGLWYESHNSALSLDAGASRLDVYHKSRLVPATESTPFPTLLGRFDDEVLGGVLARCIGQPAPSLLYCYAPSGPSATVGLAFVGGPAASGSSASDIPVAPIICYESIFGDYCREFVQLGAQLLCVITNDAWWGDTPGYRQHLDYSRLRAVETRRDVARSANTGISAFINQRGEIVASTPWWTRAVLKGKVHLNTRETFFVRHGDIVGRAATFLFLLLLALWLVRLLPKR
ncbi:MAG: apolipoprotein N-acyltransferase [Bacteroidales bacterium]|nr:apolipoprotein N-acyltransferase [Bacteroidales bacterium]